MSRLTLTQYRLKASGKCSTTVLSISVPAQVQLVSVCSIRELLLVTKVSPFNPCRRCIPSPKQDRR